MQKSGEKIAGTHKRGHCMDFGSVRPDLQWQNLMRRFSHATKEKSGTLSEEYMPTVPRSKKTFPTNSSYEGTWNVLGMSGKGIYYFPHNGVTYKGEFDDGMFHGEGELTYANGIVVKGRWENGENIERKIIFGDGTEYCENDWSYCKGRDRRLTIEYNDGLKAAGKTIATNDQPTPQIPPGHFDVGDGFYDPETKSVFRYDDLTAIVRSPNMEEHFWIIKNCRGNPVPRVGANSGLYKQWLQPLLPQQEVEYSNWNYPGSADNIEWEPQLEEEREDF